MIIRRQEQEKGSAISLRIITNFYMTQVSWLEGTMVKKDEADLATVAKLRVLRDDENKKSMRVNVVAGASQSFKRDRNYSTLFSDYGDDASNSSASHHGSIIGVGTSNSHGYQRGSRISEMIKSGANLQNAKTEMRSRASLLRGDSVGNLSSPSRSNSISVNTSNNNNTAGSPNTNHTLLDRRRSRQNSMVVSGNSDAIAAATAVANMQNSMLLGGNLLGSPTGLSGGFGHNSSGRVRSRRASMVQVVAGLQDASSNNTANMLQNALDSAFSSNASGNNLSPSNSAAESNVELERRFSLIGASMSIGNLTGFEDDGGSNAAAANNASNNSQFLFGIQEGEEEDDEDDESDVNETGDIVDSSASKIADGSRKGHNRKSRPSMTASSGRRSGTGKKVSVTGSGSVKRASSSLSPTALSATAARRKSRGDSLTASRSIGLGNPLDSVFSLVSGASNSLSKDKRLKDDSRDEEEVLNRPERASGSTSAPPPLMRLPHQGDGTDAFQRSSKNASPSGTASGNPKSFVENMNDMSFLRLRLSEIDRADQEEVVARMNGESGIME